MRWDAAHSEEFTVSHLPHNNPMPAWLERAWLARYLDRMLTAEESEWFELYALGKPHLIAAIEVDNDLRDGLALAGARVSAATGASPADAAPGDAGGGWSRWQPMAWAASVVLAMTLGWAFSGVGPGGPAAPLAQVVASPTRVVFDTLRGVASPPLVHPGAPDSRLVLIEVGLPPDATEVTLQWAGADPIPLIVSPDGFASFLLPREHLGNQPAPRVDYVSGGTAHQQVLAPLQEP